MARGITGLERHRSGAANGKEPATSAGNGRRAVDMLDRFLEFSVHTPDVLDSLGFYKSLGFAEQEIGDVWSHKYVVVSDGCISIGLHEDLQESPALTFVQPDLAKHARAMSDHGFEFSFLNIGSEEFNRLGFRDRYKNAIQIIEARTFSLPDEDTRDSVCGSWFEIVLPAADTMRSGHFWAPLAPKLLHLREEPTTHMRFDAGNASLGISESIALNSPSLCFKCQDKSALASLIELHGFKHKLYPGFEGAFVQLVAPEGTSLYVFDEDYLGESYVVDESD